MLRQLFIVIGCLVLVMGCSIIPKYNIDLDNPLHKEIQTFFDKPFTFDRYTKDAKIYRPVQYADKNIEGGEWRPYSVEEWKSLSSNIEEYNQETQFKVESSRLLNITEASDGVRVVRAITHSGVYYGKPRKLINYFVEDMVKVNSEWKIKYENRIYKVYIK